MENWHPWKMWLNVMVEIYNFHHTTSILILWFVMALRKLYGGQNGLPLVHCVKLIEESKRTGVGKNQRTSEYVK
jgi:hypothetical protein